MAITIMVEEILIITFTNNNAQMTKFFSFKNIRCSSYWWIILSFHSTFWREKNELSPLLIIIIIRFLINNKR